MACRVCVRYTVENGVSTAVRASVSFSDKKECMKTFLAYSKTSQKVNDTKKCKIITEKDSVRAHTACALSVSVCVCECVCECVCVCV